MTASDGIQEVPITLDVMADASASPHVPWRDQPIPSLLVGEPWVWEWSPQTDVFQSMAIGEDWPAWLSLEKLPFQDAFGAYIGPATPARPGIVQGTVWLDEQKEHAVKLQLSITRSVATLRHTLQSRIDRLAPLPRHQETLVTLANDTFAIDGIAVPLDRIQLTSYPAASVSRPAPNLVRWTPSLTQRFVLQWCDTVTFACVEETVHVHYQNQAPHLVSPSVFNVNLAPADYFEFALPTGVFADLDGDALTFIAIDQSLRPLPDWLQFDQEVGKLTGYATATSHSIHLLFYAMDSNKAKSDGALHLYIFVNHQRVPDFSIIPPLHLRFVLGERQQINLATAGIRFDPHAFINDIELVKVPSSLSPFLTFDTAVSYLLLVDLRNVTSLGDAGNLTMSIRWVDTNNAALLSILPVDLVPPAKESISAVHFTQRVSREEIPVKEQSISLLEKYGTWLGVLCGGSAAITFFLLLHLKRRVKTAEKASSRKQTIVPTAAEMPRKSMLKVRSIDSLRAFSPRKALLRNKSADLHSVRSSLRSTWSTQSGVEAASFYVRALVGDSFHYTYPAGLLSSKECVEPFNFSASLQNGSALPDWLHFEPTTLHFEGVPALCHRGVWPIRLIGTSPSDERVEVSFTVHVLGE